MKQSRTGLCGVLLFGCISTAAFGQSKLEIIQRYFVSHSKELSVNPSDVSSLEITAEAPSKAPGVTHVYVRQLVNGIPVQNGIASVTIKANEVVHVGNRLIGNIQAAKSNPTLSAEKALISVVQQLGVTTTTRPKLVSNDKKGNKSLFEFPEITRQAIPLQLMYLDVDGKMQLTWDMNLDMLAGNNWWSIRASAVDGSILEKHDWVISCNPSTCMAAGHVSKEASPVIKKLPPPPPGTDAYLVYELPVESPNHGNPSIAINPSDAVASPFGWHDTDGVIGDEYTITRGNNVWASDDRNNDNTPGYSPDGGPGLNFIFPFDSLTGVKGNLNAIITNLFYMNNMVHDIWQHHGFDEASGNFQETNYSNQGVDGDAVMAEAQDGSGTSNANFASPPDGQTPRMQMYLWPVNNVAPKLLSINAPSEVARQYVSVGAVFGPEITTDSVTGDIVLVKDLGIDSLDACDSIVNASELNGKIALVRRGGSCNFTSKIQACQDAGAIAVIVFSTANGAMNAMSGSSSTITIPSVMISRTDGTALINRLVAGDVVNGTLVLPPDLNVKDSDIDNVVIAHEYGHGISTRLTGGAANSGCLQNAEQMGEGWSDWIGLMITMKPDDVAAQKRGIATYLSNQDTDGIGIRPRQYSTSFVVNNYTYKATNNSSLTQPHGIGFVWATMLWDLSWALIDKYGFDANLKTGTAGNNIAMKLVIEGLKIQPCGPGFVDGRDAILEADELLYGGANQCLIWSVFAKRGLGYDASQGSATKRNDQIEAFNSSPACSVGLSENGLNDVRIYPNPTKDVLNIDMSSYNQVESIRIMDIQGKLIYESTDVKNDVVQVNLGAYQSGIYLVQLTDKFGAKSVEIVKH